MRSYLPSIMAKLINYASSYSESLISKASYLSAKGSEITMEAAEIPKDIKVARLIVVINLAFVP